MEEDKEAKKKELTNLAKLTAAVIGIVFGGFYAGHIIMAVAAAMLSASFTNKPFSDLLAQNITSLAYTVPSSVLVIAGSALLAATFLYFYGERFMQLLKQVKVEDGQ